MPINKSGFDEAKEGMMDEKMTCPNCYSCNVKKKTGKKSNESGPARAESPDEENIIYECLGCGKVFNEDDLLNLEKDQY